MIESLLGGLAVNFLTAVTKGTAKGLKKHFSKGELKSLLEQAYLYFMESYDEAEGKKDEKNLQKVFAEFFKSTRTIGEFQKMFDPKNDQVDFNQIEEIFVNICNERGIDLPDFNLFQALSNVIREMIELTPKKDKLKNTFNLAHLKHIHRLIKKKSDERDHIIIRQKYLRQLMIHNQRLQFTGIPELKEKKDITIPSVFVMQRAKESVAVKDYEQLMQENMHDEKFTGEEIHLRRMITARSEDKKEPVKFDKVLQESENKRFVVLGKPGSGKSTLLKYLMLEAAHQQLENHRAGEDLLFPVLVEIRKFENALTKTNKTDYNILDFLYDSIRKSYNLTLPEGFFEKYLNSGKALILFDGLDEVAAEARRAEVRQMISAFVTGYHSKNTVIVTSRIAGYSRAQFSTIDYRHFTLEDFNEEETGEFIRKWYCSRLSNPAEAESKANDLQEAIEKKPRIKELAKNPLLLTIVAIIHRYEAQLPEDRLILYDKATEALLYTWDNVKDIIDEKFKLDDKRRFLEKVAFHLQSLEKGDEAGTVIDRHEVYKILFPDFCRIFQVDNRQARALVDEFLDKIRTRAGLLVEQAPDQFGFAHKTFQEYFAAKWIANETILNFDPKIMIRYVDKFIDSAFWQETLLLALRAIPNKQTQKVLEYILKRDEKKIEVYFYHNHYFVMKFIAEQGKWFGNRDFVEKHVDDFFDFSWNNGKTRSYAGNRTWGRFANWVPTVTDSLVHSSISGKLLSLAEDEKQSGGLRRDCAYAMGNLGLKDQAVEILLRLAEDETQEGDLRLSCAYAMGNLGLKDQAVEILLRLAEDEKQESDLRRDCAEAVGNLGLKDQAVVERLLRLAEDEKQAGDLRCDCAEAVGNLGRKDQAVVERLLRLAEDEKQWGFLRSFCAEAVGNLGLKDQAVEILLRLAEDETQEGDLRRDCAEAVGNLGLKDQAVEILLRLAEDETQEGDLRLSCASAVGSLGLKDQAMEILLRLAQDEKQEGYLRRDCAEAMGILGRKDQAVAERLLRLAEDENQEGDLRLSCAFAVGNLGLKDQAMEILLRLAQDENRKGDLRLSCASAVGSLGLKDQAMEILLRLAQDEKQKYYLRGYSAYAIGILGEKNKAVDILIGLYLVHSDKYEIEALLIYNFLWDLTES